MNILLTFIIACIVSVDLGLAVDKCFMCTGCEDPFVTEDYIQNGVRCDHNTKESCFKYITRDRGGRVTTNRGCTPSTGPEFCEFVREMYEVEKGTKVLECETCGTDFCNSGTQITLSLLSASAAVVIAVIARLVTY